MCQKTLPAHISTKIKAFRSLPEYAAFLVSFCSNPPPPHPVYFSLRSQGGTSPSLPAGFRKIYCLSFSCFSDMWTKNCVLHKWKVPQLSVNSFRTNPIMNTVELLFSVESNAFFFGMTTQTPVNLSNTPRSIPRIEVDQKVDQPWANKATISRLYM